MPDPRDLLKPEAHTTVLTLFCVPPSALLLPVLGALPDACIIAVSGLSGSDESVQEEVAVGMGTLAGSTMMLLTIAWGVSCAVGVDSQHHDTFRRLNM